MLTYNRRNVTNCRIQRKADKVKKKTLINLRFSCPIQDRRNAENQTPRAISMRKRTQKITNRTNSKNSRQHNEIQNFFNSLDKQSEIEKTKEQFLAKKLNLCENGQIYQQDAFKLQNFITGGYCQDQDFMSLSKFNKTKDDFILLNEIYSKAKQQIRYKEKEKKKMHSRNIFSVILLNDNAKNMGKKQVRTIFNKLKITK